MYVLLVDHANDYWKCYSCMKNYAAEDAKSVRRNINSSSSVSVTGIARFRENKEPYRLFIDKFFQKFFKAEPDDPKLHRQYLNERPDIKVRLYKECIQGVTYDNDFVLDDGDGLDLSSMNAIVPMSQVFYDPANEEEVEIKIVHYLEESDVHRTAVQEAVLSKIKSVDEGLDLTAEIDLDSIEREYNDSIIKATGYLINGVPCAEENKDAWVDLIPFEHKMLAMDRMDKAELL